MVLNMSPQELTGIKNLIAVTKRNNQKLDHPVETLKLMLSFSPELKSIQKILPWVRENEKTGLTMNDIVRKLLLSYGIKEEYLDSAIEVIKKMNTKGFTVEKLGK